MEESKLYFTDQELAKIYTHMAYRNTTELESTHCESRTLDEKFYSVMYHVVKEEMNIIKQYHSILVSIHDIDDANRVLKQMSMEQVRSFKDFFEKVMFQKMFGLLWDEPMQIDEKPQNDYAAYVLNGNFKECCDKRRELDDDTMCYINKDVCNRFYTLICVNAFEKFGCGTSDMP